jgi:hypothetical protein
MAACADGGRGSEAARPVSPLFKYVVSRCRRTISLYFLLLSQNCLFKKGEVGELLVCLVLVLVRLHNRRHQALHPLHEGSPHVAVLLPHFTIIHPTNRLPETKLLDQQVRLFPYDAQRRNIKKKVDIMYGFLLVLAAGRHDRNDAKCGRNEQCSS